MHQDNGGSKDLDGGLAGWHEQTKIPGDRHSEIRGRGICARRYEKKTFPPRPRMPWLQEKGPLPF